MPTLRPPTREQAFAPRDRFWSRFTYPVGIALLVTGSAVVEKHHPTREEIDAADYAYLGGYEHVISSAEAAVLTAAGYGDYIT